MNPFTQATEEDYSADQILNYLINANPSLKKKITKAYDVGYQAQQIVNFLSGLSNARQQNRNTPSGSTQQEVRARKTLEDQLALQKGINTGLSTATGLGTASLLKSALPKVGGLLTRRGLGQAAKTVAEVPVAPASEMITEKVSEKLPLDSIKGLKADFDNLKLTSKIESLLTHKQPEVIPGLLQKQVSDEQKNILEGKYSRPFPDLVKDYADFYLSKAEEQPFSRESLTHQFNQRGNDEEEVGKKERLVALPDGGVGKLLEEKQGIGSVELPDGQIRRRKLAEMDVEPVELEKQVTSLIEAIPESERSSVLAFGSFTPDAEFEMGGKRHKGSFLGVQFHNGDFYMYPDVTQEQFDRVVNKTVKAKTTGENPWHAWVAGKGSRGAGMHELIKELEKEFGKNFIKFKSSGGYDYFKRVREIVKKIERERKSKKPKELP